MTDIEIINKLNILGKVTSYQRFSKSWCPIHKIVIDKVYRNIDLEKMLELISHFDSLYSLTIRGESLISEIPLNINKLTQLEELTITETLIEEEPNLSKLINLEKLVINNNCNMSKISDNIMYLVNLKELNLSYNSIEKIPKSLNKLKKLEILDLSSNKIKKISNIFSLVHLRILNLHHNNINYLPTSLSKIKELRELYLYGNPILKDYKNISYKIENNPKLLISLFRLQNKIKIDRFFYPVGQGAFYAEKHKLGYKNFTVVYDCGSKAPKRSDEMIEKVFRKNQIIDILFISHFDYDHVSSINKLKKWTKIKKVIMPLLQEDEIYLLSNIYTVLEFNNIIQLIRNPEEYFGKNTKIIRINPSSETERPIFEEGSQHINSLSTTINSGTVFHIKSDYKWVFIPFNYQQKDRISKLEDELLKEDFDIDKLKSDTKYILNSIEKDRAKIKKIYTKLKEDINENSMLLYSGLPFNTKNTLKKKSYLFDFKNNIRWHGITKSTNRISCIYTGDTNLRKVRIEHIFRQWWNTIGTIQIPHHGDKNSFDKYTLSYPYKNYFCPISVGTNSYGHPSKNVIEDILSLNNFPILVNEDLSSGFVEYIDNSEIIQLIKDSKDLESAILYPSSLIKDYK